MKCVDCEHYWTSGYCVLTHAKRTDTDNCPHMLVKMRTDLEATKKDAERLDWTERYMDSSIAGFKLRINQIVHGENQTLREAIDAAMKEGSHADD